MKKILTVVVLTVLSAGISMASGVKIDSDTLDIKERGNVSYFKGHVRIKSPDMTVRSKEALSDKKAGTITAMGSVEVEFSSDTWSMKGDCSRIVITDSEKEMLMTGDVRLEYYSTDIETDTATVVHARQVRINYAGRRRAYFEQDVVVERGDMNIFADRGIYRHDEKSILFTGNPHGESRSGGSRGIYSGNEMLLLVDDEKIVIRGEAYTRLRMNNGTEM